MKRLVTLALVSAASWMSATTLKAEISTCFAPDTTIRVKDKLITTHERGNRFDVTVRRISPSGDTIRARQVFRGQYDLRRREVQYDLGDKIRIPIIKPKRDNNGKNGNAYRLDSEMLGFGWSKYVFGGETARLNSLGSYRFTLGLVAWNLYNRNTSFTLGTSFDFNKIHFYDNYTLRRNAEEVTQLVAPEEGRDFGKNRLSATYFNVYGRFTVRPFSHLARKFYLYGYTGCKVRTASSYKAWENKDVQRFDGDRNLSNVLLEVGGGLGYDWFGLQVLHTPQSIFTAGKGPDLRLTTIGVTLWF